MGHGWKGKSSGLHVALAAIDAKIKAGILPDPTMYPGLFERKLLADATESGHGVQIRTIYHLMRRGHELSDIAASARGKQPRPDRRFYGSRRATGEHS